MSRPDSALKKYRAAIKRNFPDFALTSISYLAEGWDSVACLVNKEWVFRFPKRDEVAQRLLDVEVPVTAALAPHLPLAIPQFEFVAANSVASKSFAGYKMLPGVPLDDFVPEIWQIEWWQQPVAEFLVALHSFPLKQAIALGLQPLNLIDSALLNPNFIADSNLVELWRQALLDFYQLVQQEIYPQLMLSEQAVIDSQYQQFLDNLDFFQFTPTVIHGDFSAEHILLDLAQKRVCGVIDFGDVALGDPAYDLWPEILNYYVQLRPNAATDATLAQRCLFYKKLVPLHALLFGKKMGDFALSEFGRYELKRLWLDS